MFRRKKIGYTLTELLVVVMIIAVLSAVVLPKFSKVLETRKTTEAEDLMTAVRQEQEYRCAADKPYASNASQLQSLANAKTKNFTLSFQEGGIEAAREGKKYKLSIPSYADGRICCEDINNSGQCAELNKEYPECSNLKNTADYQAAPTNCLAEGLAEGEAPTGECENGATQEEACGPSCDRGTRVVKECVNGVWQNRNGECSVADHPCTCEYYTGKQKPASITRTCHGCGTQTVSYSCNETTWQWVPSAGTCYSTQNPSLVITKEADCPKCAGKEEEKNSCYRSSHSNHTGTWDDSQCKCICPEGTELDSYGECTDVCYGHENERELCTDASYSGTFFQGSWDNESCTCTCPQGSHFEPRNGCVGDCDVWQAQNCEMGQQGRGVPGNWDWSTCSCACPAGSIYFEGICVTSKCSDEDDQGWGQDIYWCTHDHLYSDLHVRGRWNPNTCTCECLYGAYVQNQVCLLLQGYDADDYDHDIDECIMNPEACDAPWGAYEEGYYDDLYGDDYWDDYGWDGW